MPELATHLLGSTTRRFWSSQEEQYREVRAAVERGHVLVLAFGLNPSGAIGAEGTWNWQLLGELAKGVARLRGDGLGPRVACWYRTDVVGGAQGEAFDPDCPADLALPAESPRDQAERYLRAREELGLAPALLPVLANDLGRWDTRTGPLFDLSRQGPVVVYYDNHTRETYTAERVWRIRAVLLDPDHPDYTAWVVESARRQVARIVERYPVLEGLELELHAKDRHVHALEGGGFLDPPLTEFSAEGRCSGLSTWPEPYRRLPNWARRALVHRAMARGGVASFSRLWIPGNLRGLYVEALPDGAEWSR